MARKKADNPAFKEKMQDFLFHGCDVKGEHHKFKSIQDFAKFLGVSRQSLGFWIHNNDDKRRSPDMDGLIKVSKALNMSIDYLVGLSETNSLDADIQTASRYTGLSEAAIKSLNTGIHPIWADKYEDEFEDEMRMADYINGFIEGPGFIKLRDILADTITLAGIASRVNSDESLKVTIPHPGNDPFVYETEFMLSDTLGFQYDWIGRCFSDYARSYFKRLIENIMESEDRGMSDQFGDDNTESSEVQ